MARALTNMVGNCVATVVVGVWEKDIDRERALSVLNGEIKVDLNAVPVAALADEREALVAAGPLAASQELASRS